MLLFNLFHNSVFTALQWHKIICVSPQRWGFLCGGVDGLRTVVLWAVQHGCWLSHILTTEKLLTTLWGFGSLCKVLVLFQVVVDSCHATARAIKCLCQGEQWPAAPWGAESQDLRVINQPAGLGPPWPRSCFTAPQSEANLEMAPRFSQKSNSSVKFMLMRQVQG